MVNNIPNITYEYLVDFKILRKHALLSIKKDPSGNLLLLVDQNI